MGPGRSERPGVGSLAVLESRDKGRRPMGRFETAGRKFIEAFNRHDADATAKLYANDCVVHDPLYPEPLVGRNAVKEDNANFFRAFPDIRFEIVEILDRGDVGSAEM